MYMSKNIKLIMLITLLALLVAAPMTSAEKASKFAVSRTMFIAGTQIKAGTYNVKYETNSPEATVTFLAENGKVVAEVKGKVVESATPAEYNALSTGQDASGRDAIKALIFRNKTTTIIFE